MISFFLTDFVRFVFELFWCGIKSLLDKIRKRVLGVAARDLD
jgi:hypothetical protein